MNESFSNIITENMFSRYVGVSCIEDEDVRAYLYSVIQEKWSTDKDREAEILSEIPVFIERILQSIHDGNDIVIFVAVNHGNFPSIEYIAKALGEQKNRSVYGIYLISEAPSGVYDNAICCGGSLHMLAELIRNIPAASLYVQAHARWGFLSQFIKSVNPHLRIVQEVYDWMGAFIDHKEIFISEGVFSEMEIRLIMEAEEYVRNHTDAFVYKNGGKWMKQAIAESRSPSLQILPCPPREWMKKPIAQAASGRTRLVYAGQVMNNRASERIFGDMNYHRIIKDLTDQGLYITVFNSVFSSREFPDEYYERYLQEAERNDFFDFRYGLPMPEIIDELHGNYEYGLIINYFHQDLVVGKNHLAEAMASKLFTYLASGIPVIVSEEFEYMADFVKDNEIGIVVSQDEISRLDDILKSVDYVKMMSGVIRAQQLYYIERYIPQICNLLEDHSCHNCEQGQRISRNDVHEHCK